MITWPEKLTLAFSTACALMFAVVLNYSEGDTPYFDDLLYAIAGSLFVGVCVAAIQRRAPRHRMKLVAAQLLPVIIIAVGIVLAGARIAQMD